MAIVVIQIIRKAIIQSSDILVSTINIRNKSADSNNDIRHDINNEKCVIPKAY